MASLALSDLSSIWSKVGDFAEARLVLASVLPDLVDLHGSVSAALAAEWYADSRESTKVRGSFVAAPAVIADSAVPQLIDWAVSTGYNLTAIKTLLDGGVSRRVQDWGRQTIIKASVEDPESDGWMRVGRPNHCSWCTQYLDGEVHQVEGYDFRAHDHCHCFTVPVFAHKAKPGHLILPEAA